MPRLLALSRFVLLPLAFAAALQAQTIHVEAEAGTLEGPTLRIEPNPAAPATTPMPHDYSGAGYVTGFTMAADHLALHVSTTKPGFYTLAVVYRSPKSKGYDITINDTSLTGKFPLSAGFTSFTVGKVELLPGDNSITFNRGWGYYDIDAIDLTPAPAAPPLLPVTTPPVDPRITPEARSLLARIDDGYGKTTPLGVYTDEDATYTLATTGLRPAIMGGDVLRYNPAIVARQAPKSDEIARVIADYQAGYIVTLSWHWSPMGGMREGKPWWSGFYTESNSTDVNTVLDPSTPEHTSALADIDAIAVQLRRLQEAHVPILWRPLHEAQGGWFWWGAQGSTAFKQLWNMVYDRLVNVDGIHNLIWVFTSGDDPAWYPGDSRVDIVAVDSYPSSIHGTESGLWSELLQQFNGRKPLAIAEFGGVPDIPSMQHFGETWAYAVSWSGEVGPRKNTPAELIRIYTSPGVTTLPPPSATASPAALSTTGQSTPH